MSSATTSTTEYDFLEDLNVIPPLYSSDMDMEKVEEELYHISPCGSPCSTSSSSTSSSNLCDQTNNHNFRVHMVYLSCMCDSCVYARACSLGPPLNPEIDCECYLPSLMSNLEKLEEDRLNSNINSD